MSRTLGCSALGAALLKVSCSHGDDVVGIASPVRRANGAPREPTIKLQKSASL